MALVSDVFSASPERPVTLISCGASLRTITCWPFGKDAEACPIYRLPVGEFLALCTLFRSLFRIWFLCSWRIGFICSVQIHIPNHEQSCLKVPKRMATHSRRQTWILLHLSHGCLSTVKAKFLFFDRKPGDNFAKYLAKFFWTSPYLFSRDASADDFLHSDQNLHYGEQLHGFQVPVAKDTKQSNIPERSDADETCNVVLNCHWMHESLTPKEFLWVSPSERQFSFASELFFSCFTSRILFAFHKDSGCCQKLFCLCECWTHRKKYFFAHRKKQSEQERRLPTMRELARSCRLAQKATMQMSSFSAKRQWVVLLLKQWRCSTPYSITTRKETFSREFLGSPMETEERLRNKLIWLSARISSWITREDWKKAENWWTTAKELSRPNVRLNHFLPTKDVTAKGLGIRIQNRCSLRPWFQESCDFSAFSASH